MAATSSEMTTPKSQNTLSREEQEVKIIAAREESAKKKPKWAWFAEAHVPYVYQQADQILSGLKQLEAETDEKTAPLEKWVVIEAQMRETAIEQMTYLDALAQHVDTWTECDPATIAKLLEGATTEREHLNILLGSHLQPLFDKAQGISYKLENMAIID